MIKKISILLVLLLSVNSFSQTTLDEKTVLYSKKYPSDSDSSGYLHVVDLNRAIYQAFKNKDFSFIRPFIIKVEDYNNLVPVRERVLKVDEFTKRETKLFQEGFNNTLEEGQNFGFNWRHLNILSYRDEKGQTLTPDFSEFTIKKAEINNKYQFLIIEFSFKFDMRVGNKIDKFELNYETIITNRGCLLYSRHFDLLKL